MKSKYFLIVAGLMLVLFSYSSAQVPQMINYQGKLTKSSGAPLDTTVQMIFSIYADSNGTILKWTENQVGVKVEKGIFNVLLGSVNPIPDTVFDGNIRYLGVTVGGDPEITPRKPMVSVAYAFHALTADSALNVAEAGLVSVDGVSNPGGDVDLIQQNAITITPDDGANTIAVGETHSSKTDNPHQTTAAQTGALVSVDGVSNAGGNVDFVAGSNMTITPDDGANTITFSATTGGIGGSGTTNYIPKFTGSTTIGNSVIYETGGNLGIGTSSPNEQLEITGNLRLPATTATTGIIKVGADRFIHNYGSGNTFVGVNAGNLSMTGYSNTANGYLALYYNTTGSYNTANGWRTLYYNTIGSYNTANGYWALYSNTTGSDNTAYGDGALYSNTTGGNNTANGTYALFANRSGYLNTANGQQALYSNTTGYYNTANGYNSLYSNTTGYYNTANGVRALYSNITGSNNTALGYQADVSAGNLTNATAIGANAIVSASNSMVLGGTGANAVKVGIGTTSPQGALDVTSTTGAFIVPRMTTAQRDALTAVNGMIIYNTTTNQFNFYENGAWVTK